MGSNYSGGYGTPDGLGGYSKYSSLLNGMGKVSVPVLCHRGGKGAGPWAGEGKGGSGSLKWNLWGLYTLLLQQTLAKSSSAGLLLV